jgi:hypothetical protein
MNAEKESAAIRSNFYQQLMGAGLSRRALTIQELSMHVHGDSALSAEAGGRPEANRLSRRREH